LLQTAAVEGSAPAGRGLPATSDTLQQAVRAGITAPVRLTPAAVDAAGEPLRAAIVEAYAGSLAPVFWYLLPILGVALLLSLVLEEIPLSQVAGMVARGEAVESAAPAVLPVAQPRTDRDDDPSEAHVRV
jgi:hypothetical protein